MDRERIAKVAERVAQGEEEGTEDEALAFVDQAVDTMIASVKILDANLSKVQPDNVAQKAALDEARKILDEGVAPYLADLAKALEVFD